jgi:steroid Delta-isomerase
VDPYEYAEVFNAAVITGEWSAFLDRFTEDATMEFVGPPVGPFVGRTAIADAYEKSPPDDTIEILSAGKMDGEKFVVPYRWQTSGATGSMNFTERGVRVHRLVVTFD